MTDPTAASELVHGHPYVAEIDAERDGWYQLLELVRRLTPDERLVSGYYEDPAWTVRDVVAHLGTWKAEAEVQLERLGAGTYEGRDIDIDALNAAFLAADAGCASVRMGHVREAARREYEKLEKPLSDAEVRGWP